MDIKLFLMSDSISFKDFQHGLRPWCQAIKCRNLHFIMGGLNLPMAAMTLTGC